jgi:hypothetical protein
MRRIVLAAMSISAVASGGCMATGPAGRLAPRLSGTAYARGWASRAYPVPSGEISRAASEAMADLEVADVVSEPIPPRGAPSEGPEGDASGEVPIGEERLRGRSQDRRPVTVVIRPRGIGSEVEVRVGRFGDEAFSRAVLDRIGVRAGTLSPTAIPIDPPSTPASNPFFSREAVPDSVMLQGQGFAGYNDSPVP